MHRHQPLVSICVPVYNGGTYLKDALVSCLQQTYPHIEIVVCDDGSTDSTLEIVSRFASPIIRVHKNKHNLGLVGNWNKTIEVATGSWIKLLFQDDLMEKDCVEKMINACLNDNTRIAICARKFLFERNADIKLKNIYINQLTKPEDKFTSKRLYVPAETAAIVSPYPLKNILGEPICFLFHKSLYDDVGGFNSEYRQMVDYEYALKAVLNNSFSFLNEALVSFRVHHDSTTSQNVAQTNFKRRDAIRIDASAGDYIRLLESYLNNKDFSAMKSYWGEGRIRLLEKYFYLRSCSRYGQQTVRMALNKLISENCVLKNYRYRRLKFLYVRYQYKKQIKPYLNK